MAKAVFSKPFDFTDHSRGMSLHFDASEDEVTSTEEVISAAIEAGVAKRVGAAPKTAAPAAKETVSTNTAKGKTAPDVVAGSSTPAVEPTTDNPTGKTSGSTSTTTSSNIPNTATNATTTSKG